MVRITELDGRVNMTAGVTTRDGGPSPRYVIISGYHDYRSKRKANLHFIADELKTRGETLFLSVRYSFLTRYREDPRLGLAHCANRFETVDDVRCYLWRTPLHPFRLPQSFFRIEKIAFALYSLRLPRVVLAAVCKAETVFIESGTAITFVPLIKRHAPHAKIIYMASDSLAAIGQAQSIKDVFKRSAHLFDSARVPSPYLRDDVPTGMLCYYIPHGIHKEKFDAIGPSPFAPGTRNAVSVGSMLFDPSFFEIAGRLFPDITFHVIGSGHGYANLDNVVYYAEMPFQTTLPYLKHCTFAVAAYGAGVEPYLTHTSMKLMQYSYLGIPSVCPDIVCGDIQNRFGYVHGNKESILAAVDKALQVRRSILGSYLGWDEVTDRLLSPTRFVDTKL